MKVGTITAMGKMMENDVSLVSPPVSLQFSAGDQPGGPPPLPSLTTLDSEEKVDSLDTVMALQIESPTSRVLVRTSQGSALPLLTLTGHWSVSPSYLLSPVWARLCSPATAGSQLQAQAEK